MAGEVDDAKILRDLFEGTGVMSALDHSKIEGANNPEALNIDAQAARIARRAAAALRQSRAACVVPIYLCPILDSFGHLLCAKHQLQWDTAVITAAPTST